MKKVHLLPLFMAIFSSIVFVWGGFSPVRADTNPSPTSNEPITLAPLAELRNEIVFQEYTPEENQLLADQARLVLGELYVHRYIKNALLGVDIDAAIQVEHIAANAWSMTTEELQISLSSVFNDQRDGHLDFFFPAPYSCYVSLLPFRLTEVFASEKAHKIVVKSLRDLPVVMDRAPQVGDELLAYNGKSIVNAIEDEIATRGGTNNSGGYTTALYTLTVRDHRVHLVPESDHVWAVFKTPAGEVYQLKVPWTVQRYNDCALPHLGHSSQAAHRPLEAPIASFSELSSNDYVRRCATIDERYVAPLSVGSFPETPTRLPDLSWTIIENTDGRFGYIRLKSFMWRGYEADMAFEEIVNIIKDEMRQTDGLIIDVRDNPGGTIDLADRLPQLFAPTHVATQGARLLNTELNAHILNNSFLGKWPTSKWADLINEVSGTDRRYSRTAQFTDDTLANAHGQVYFKPVAVMMNANTYSAAELFVAAMQDNKLATIFGEDLKTGGGGAHVMTHSQLTAYVGLPFETLPRDQEMRVAWRQFVREGQHAGMLIEELGVVADRRIRPTLNDILNGGEGQLQKITRELRWQKWNKESFIEFVHPHRRDYSIDDIALDATIAATDTVRISVNGDFVQQQYLNIWDARAVPIEIPSNLCEIGDVLEVELLGFDYGDPAWRVIKQLNILGHKVHLGQSGRFFDFSQAVDIEPFAIVNIRPWINSTPENGWNLRNGTLGIGNGAQYKRNVKSDATLMMDLSDMAAPTLSFTADIQTEAGFDYLEITATSGDDRLDLGKLSGTLPKTTYTYDLQEFAGRDNVALHFLFFSDGWMTDRGVEIYDIRLD